VLFRSTGIGWAIQASTTFLKKSSERSKVIILITDGENSAGPTPMETAPLAVRERIKVYTILIGPDMVTPTAAANHPLNKVARMTGGQFFQANDARALQGIYHSSDQAGRGEVIRKRFASWREFVPWFTGVASAFWIGGLVGSQLVRRRVP